MNLVVTRVFEAPVAAVWKAWSDPALVKRWWGPKGFTYPLARIDFREGGVSLVCMRAPKAFGGKDLHNTWTYESRPGNSPAADVDVQDVLARP